MILSTFVISAIAASNPVFAANQSGDSYRLTPSELQRAQERVHAIEGAREANVDARRAARLADDDITSMAAESIDAGVLLTFDEQSFSGEAELTPAARRRLDALADFLMRHAERTIKVRAPASDLSNAEARAITARSAALRRHLTRAGIADDRLLLARIDLDIAATARTAVQLVIEDSAIPRGIAQ